MNEQDRRQIQALIALGWTDHGNLDRIAKAREAEGWSDLCEALLSRRLLSAELAARVRQMAQRTMRPSRKIAHSSSAMIRVGSGARPSGSGWSPPSSGDGSQVWRAGTAWTAPEAFEIIEELGRGAMGVVYKARERETGRLVALKFIQGEAGDDDIKRFRREALTLVRLKHPRLVEIVDVSFDSQNPFIALEFVEGQSLSAAIDDTLRVDGELPDFEQISWILEDLASALDYCHEQGVIHRDVKPQNIVLDEAEERAVLIDFGLLKRSAGDDGIDRSLSLTGTRDMVGTPAFMSPEQFFPKGEFGAVGPASDVWGFGATLFYVVTGAPPFSQPTALDIAMAIKDGQVPRLAAARPGVSPWLAELCADCLRLQAADRPSMAEVRARLSAGPPARRRRFHPGLALLALALSVTIGLAIYGLSGGQAAPATAPPPSPKPEPGPKPLLPSVDLDAVTLTFDHRRVLGRLFLEEGDALKGTVTGLSRGVPISLGGRNSGLETGSNGRFELPVEAESDAITLTLFSEAGTRVFKDRVLTRSSYRAACAALEDLEVWDEAGEMRQDLAIALVTTNLAAGFVHMDTRVYKAGNQEHRIARFCYEPWDLDMLLIPGSKVEARWISRFDHADELVKLEALLIRQPPTAELARALEVIFRRNWELLTSGIKEAHRSRQFTELEREAIVEFVASIREDGRSFDDSSGRREAVVGALKKSLEVQKKRFVAQSTETLAPFLIARSELTINEGRRIIGSALKTEGGDEPLVHDEPERSEDKLAQSGSAFRLPWRVELQYAMAGSRSLREGWFDDPSTLSEREWHKDNAQNRGHSASEHAEKTNPFGLIDSLGNHSEWARIDLDRWAEVLDASSLEFPDFWRQMGRYMGIRVEPGQAQFKLVAKNGGSFVRYALVGGNYEDPPYLLRPSTQSAVFRMGRMDEWRKMAESFFRPRTRQGRERRQRYEGGFRLVFPIPDL